MPAQPQPNPPMSKSDRLEMLRQAAARVRSRNSRFLAGALFAANLAVIAKRDTRDTDQRIASLAQSLRTEEAEMPSQLEREETEDDSRALAGYLLSPAERRSLERDWRRKVSPAPVAVADPDAFPPGYVNPAFEPFVPAFAGLAEPNAFELDVADQPLMLMAAPTILQLTA